MMLRTWQAPHPAVPELQFAGTRLYNRATSGTERMLVLCLPSCPNIAITAEGGRALTSREPFTVLIL